MKPRTEPMPLSDLPLFAQRGVATLANEPASYGVEKPEGRKAGTSSLSPALDYCGEKHGGNAESEAAFDALTESGEAERQRARVLAAVLASGSVGVTCRELAEAMGCGLNCISGRFTELAAEGLIKRKETDGQVWRRDGCAVWVANLPTERNGATR